MGEQIPSIVLWVSSKFVQKRILKIVTTYNVFWKEMVPKLCPEIPKFPCSPMTEKESIMYHIADHTLPLLTFNINFNYKHFIVFQLDYHSHSRASSLIEWYVLIISRGVYLSVTQCDNAGNTKRAMNEHISQQLC